jgi:hypothetical protein
MGVARETLWLASVCTIDLLVTMILIATGRFTEANPLLGHYLRYGLGAMGAVKLASFAIPLAVAEWQRRRTPGFVVAALRLTLCVYVVGYLGGVAVANLPLLLFSR